MELKLQQGKQNHLSRISFALIPPFFLECIVAIGILGGDGAKNWVASGFLYGDFIEKISETESSYRIFLVTNRHVLNDKGIVYLRFNPEANESAREFDLPLKDEKGNRQWFAHPDPSIDIAVVPINGNALREERIKFNWFQSDQHVMDRAKANESGITEGDGVFVLGFPMGLVGRERNYVITRLGTIARIRDTLLGASKDFLVDTTIFPGNSGGPVVLKPEFLAIQGSKAQHASYLIGVVKGYIPYREEAISKQTGNTRIVFEENSGLAAVIPIDFVKETIQDFLKTERHEKP